MSNFLQIGFTTMRFRINLILVRGKSPRKIKLHPKSQNERPTLLAILVHILKHIWSNVFLFSFCKIRNLYDHYE